MEKEIICSYKVEKVYNKHPTFPIQREENFRYICEIRGQRFDSVYEASKKLGEKESSISNKFKNGVEDYVLIAKVRHGYEPIIADGFVYDSIAAAVNDKRAINRLQAYQFLKNKTKKD